MSRKDGVLALLVVVVWGLNFVVIKVGLHNMPPLMLAGLRFMLVAFPAIFFVARPKVPLNLLLGYGLTISFAQFAFLFCAINFGMPAGLASLVLQAQAFFTIMLGAFTFGERLHGKQLAGIALAIFGVLVTTTTLAQEVTTGCVVCSATPCAEKRISAAAIADESGFMIASVTLSRFQLAVVMI